jgi:hypothetical protein
MATTAVALMVAVMTAAAVTANAMAAVAVMATAMAAARQQRQWRQQQWQWRELQQSTEKGTTKTAMATEMATVTDSVLLHQPEWPGIPPPPGAEGWGGRDMVVKMRMWREEMYWRQIQRKEE